MKKINKIGKKRLDDIYFKIDENSNFDMKGFAEKLIEKSVDEDLLIENDPEKLKHLVNDDIIDGVPPQIYKLISGIIDLVGDGNE